MPLSAEDRLAIAEVIARYCHATDTGDGPGVADQFTDDGILEITGAWQARGRAQIEQIGSFPNKPKHWINSMVMDGTGSTAESTVYYAAVRGGGPLYATGRYESTLTKNFKGQWKFIHHRYTGDPAASAPTGRPAMHNAEVLDAEDRVQIIELISRLNRALQDRDGATLGTLFTDNGTWQRGDGASQPATDVTAILTTLAATEGSYWATNFIIEGTGLEATVRAYFALLADETIVETGVVIARVAKIQDRWRFDRHHYMPDTAPP